MTNPKHIEAHREQLRFGARQAITTVGANCGTECAIAATKGMIDGAIDELVTMLGTPGAFEYLMSVSDRLVRAPDAQMDLRTFSTNTSPPPSKND